MDVNRIVVRSTLLRRLVTNPVADQVPRTGAVRVDRLEEEKLFVRAPGRLVDRNSQPGNDTVAMGPLVRVPLRADAEAVDTTRNTIAALCRQTNDNDRGRVVNTRKKNEGTTCRKLRQRAGTFFFRWCPSVRLGSPVVWRTYATNMNHIRNIFLTVITIHKPAPTTVTQLAWLKQGILRKHEKKDRRDGLR